jgi:L-lactate dehydrogenase (cytochrome)
MRLRDRYAFRDFRALARRRLPIAIFDCIDGAVAVTHRQHTASCERCELVPNFLRGVKAVDILMAVLGQKLAAAFYFSHSAAAARCSTMFGVSSLGPAGLEELRTTHDTPQAYQVYCHKDRGLNRAMLQRAKEVGGEVTMLTADSITGGHRQRDLRAGFSIPSRLALGTFKFAIKPMRCINCVTHASFKRPQLDDHVDMSGGTLSLHSRGRAYSGSSPNIEKVIVTMPSTMSTAGADKGS